MVDKSCEVGGLGGLGGLGGSGLGGFGLDRNGPRSLASGFSEGQECITYDCGHQMVF